ncbi:hypothetical protein SOM16_09310 [Pedobacter sp. CFBP9032]|nr:hypothetical protein [Pedobacter sp. CFBP9032]
MKTLTKTFFAAALTAVLFSSLFLYSNSNKTHIPIRIGQKGITVFYGGLLLSFEVVKL